MLNEVLNRLCRAAETAKAKDLDALISVAQVSVTLAELTGNEE